MPLQLKETPEEKAERAWRKAQRLKRKDKHQSRHSPSRSSKRRKPAAAAPGTYDYVFDVPERAWDPAAGLRSDVPAPEGGRLGREDDDDDEAGFRARLFDALGEDGGADEREAAFAGYVPSRWHRPSGSGSGSGSGFGSGSRPGAASGAALAEMTEEEYAEWVRAGMWRRTHGQEVEDAQRAAAARAEQGRRERVWLAEERRKERERERRREGREREREERARRGAWEAYERGWEAMGGRAQIAWRDVPWPSFVHPAGPEELTQAAMREFVMSDAHSAGRTRRERAREQLLRWHPDKFEGRWMGKVGLEGERERIREGVGVVVRFLGELGNEKEA